MSALLSSTVNPNAIDAAATASLEARLRANTRGDVRFDRLHRAIYSTDAGIHEIAPVGVFLPRDESDVVTAVRECAALKVPIVARGAGTGIAGGAVGWGLQIDFSRYLTRIIEIDPVRRLARVQAGVVLDDLNATLAPHGLHFPADVATASRATLGGMISNNSAGSHSVYYGRTVDYLAGLRVVLSDGSVAAWRHAPFDDLPPTADGRTAQRPFALGSQRVEGDEPTWTPETPLQREIERELGALRGEIRDEALSRYPRVLRRNGGYALDRLCLSPHPNPATLICGSEGTLGLVVEATLRLAPLPRYRALLVLHFENTLSAVAATPRALAHSPAAVELIDGLILDAGIPLIPAAVRDQFLRGRPRALLVVELYDEDEATLHGRLEALSQELAADNVGQPAVPVIDAGIQAAVWALRNKGFGLLMSRPGQRHPYEFIEDAAVAPDQLADYIRELDAMLVEEGVTEAAHYAHASVGVIHVRPTLNLHDPADRTRLRRVAERTCALVARYGGAMTGEHGDGLLRSEWLERVYGPRITSAFARIKRAFDPANLFNPGKIVAPLPMDQRLKPAGRHASLPLPTYFDYSAYGGMQGMAEMCAGVGACRQKLVGTMCPSYMATLDELHTTRARANALRAALSDRGLLDGVADPALDEVMDLCISCKACKSECPTGVDMARLKAEWLAARIRRHGASRGDRFFAEAASAARRASRWPGLANRLQRFGPFRRLLEWRYGVDRSVSLPEFSSQTFRQWWRAHQAEENRASGPPPRGRVLYFADTWTNYFRPQVGIAAVRLLEAAGYHVISPSMMCCGRPLISRGYLAEAAEQARENIDRLAGLGTDLWITGTEPSCLLTFIDEAPQLVRTENARRIATRVRTVESLLLESLRNGSSLEKPNVQPGRVLLHAHCHQKSLIGTSDTLELLRAAFADVSEINAGCCGMAGSFGHEKRHVPISRAIGEQRLFPAVRTRGEAQIAVTGFSCTEQIGQYTDAKPRHALELVADATLGVDSTPV